MNANVYKAMGYLQGFNELQYGMIGCKPCNTASHWVLSLLNILGKTAIQLQSDRPHKSRSRAGGFGDA